MTTNTIHFLMTGGTIDSRYDGTKDTVVTNTTSIIPQVIDSIKPYAEVHYQVICMKDSRELNSQDQEALIKAINSSAGKMFIITHGTYTMADTARIIEKKLENRSDKTIILTGSMIPIDGFSMSDGPFNLGYAFSQVQALEPGVYVCMNGHTFKPDDVSKSIAEGRFTSIFS